MKNKLKIKNLVIGSLTFILLLSYTYKLIKGFKQAEKILNNHLSSQTHLENIVAHRGFSSLFKDNSKEAILKSLSSDCVDIIEIDIQKIAGFKTIIEHNSAILFNNSLTNIKDLDYDLLTNNLEIRGYLTFNIQDFLGDDFLFLYKRYFQKENNVNDFYFLEDFLTWYDFSKQLILDLKTDEIDINWMQELNTMFFPYQDKIFFQSSYYPFLEKVQELYPNYRYLYIIDSKSDLEKTNDNFFGYTVKYNLIDYLQVDNSKMYFIYTINSNRTYFNVINSQNYQSNFYIITDNPDYICALYENKKLRK